MRAPPGTPTNLLDLQLVPSSVDPVAVASAVPNLLDASWDRASVGGRWKRFDGNLVELARPRAPGTGLAATSGAGHRVELGKNRLLVTLAADHEVTDVVRRVPAFMRALRARGVELDLGAVRWVGEDGGVCPGRFVGDAIVDIASERWLDLYEDPPAAWDALAHDPLPPGVERLLGDGSAVLSWTSSIDAGARRRALSVRSTWLQRVLGGRAVATGATPEPPCRASSRPPPVECEARVDLPATPIGTVTRLVRRLVDGEPGRPWPAALDGDAPDAFALRTGRRGAREYAVQLFPAADQPRWAPRLLVSWATDAIVVRYGPVPEPERADGDARVARLLDRIRGELPAKAKRPR